MSVRLLLPRRRLLAMGFAALLSACGGGDPAQFDEMRDPTLLTEAHAARSEAETVVSAGLVGAVFATQAESASKLYLGKAGLRKPQGAALQGNEAFNLGSASKSMTAALAARWVEKGVLRWDSKPADLLPELAAKQHPAYANVTLAQLLNHRAGLIPGDPADLAAFAEFLATQTVSWPQTETGRRRFLSGYMLSLPPAGQPGTEFVYSNAGYTVAGAMLEAATGKDFETLMREFLNPLGVHPVWQVISTDAVGHEGESPATLQAYAGFGPELQPWVDATNPSGSVRLTPAELGLWLAEHQRALRGGQHALPASYVQTLRDLQRGDYALGWVADTVNGHAVLSHTGADAGFMSMVLVRRDGHRAHFALTNTFGVGPGESSWVLDALSAGLIRLASR